MYAKIRISGDILLKTGMHIGEVEHFAAIGAVDSPVIKDVLSGYPMIPWELFKRKNKKSSRQRIKYCCNRSRWGR